MAWEWIVLVSITVIGPTVFHRFLPIRQEITVLGGAVFTVNYGPVARILRTTFKFAVVWGSRYCSLASTTGCGSAFGWSVLRFWEAAGIFSAARNTGFIVSPEDRFNAKILAWDPSKTKWKKLRRRRRGGNGNT